MGFGTRKHDMIPYRAMGPVTVEKYESLEEFYNQQLQEIINFDVKDKTTEEKMKALRDYREE